MAQASTPARRETRVRGPFRVQREEACVSLLDRRFEVLTAEAWNWRPLRECAAVRELRLRPPVPAEGSRHVEPALRNVPAICGNQTGLITLSQSFHDRKMIAGIFCSFRPLAE